MRTLALVLFIGLVGSTAAALRQTPAAGERERERERERECEREPEREREPEPQTTASARVPFGLAPTDPTASSEERITGTVADPTGVPVRAQVIVRNREDRPVAGATTDAAGHFDLRVHESGDLELSVIDGRGVLTRLPVHLDPREQLLGFTLDVPALRQPIIIGIPPRIAEADNDSGDDIPDQVDRCPDDIDGDRDDDDGCPDPAPFNGPIATRAPQRQMFIYY